jgi:hypothetical protein
MHVRYHGTLQHLSEIEGWFVYTFDANIKLAYPYNKVFNPGNLVFLLLSIQSIRLTTYCNIFVKQLHLDILV